MTDVHIVGVGRTRYGRFPGRTTGDLAADALRRCLADADAELADVQGVFFANTAQGALEGQHLIRGQVALRAAGVERIPVFNVENACASGSSAFHLAAMAIRAGEMDVALAVGADKLFGADRASTEALFNGGMEVTRIAAALDELRTAAGDVSGHRGTGTVFMSVYAAFAAQYMRRHPDVTAREFAAVTVKNRRHAALNPYATHRQPITVEEVLAAREVAAPLTVPMCAPIGDGAAAVLLCAPSVLDRFDRARAVPIRASVVVSGSGRELGDDREHITRRAAIRAYRRAGLGPRDVSIAEVHDATAVGEVLQVELLGLVEAGDGATAAARGETALGGLLPVNTSGGLEGNGHPAGATGIGQLHELVTQLRGEAGTRQATGVRIALAENGGGLLGKEEAAAVVTILEAPARRRT